MTELSAQEVDQLFELRRVLEQHAVESTFPLPGRPSAEVFALVRHWLDQMRAAVATGDELGKDDAHRAFHAAVVALAGNRQLDLALEPILLKLQRPMALNLRREAQARGPEEGLQRHEHLLNALETNDRGAVLAELAHHGMRSFLNVPPAPG